jgi:hypothetical protein
VGYPRNGREGLRLSYSPLLPPFGLARTPGSIEDAVRHAAWPPPPSRRSRLLAPSGLSPSGGPRLAPLGFLPRSSADCSCPPATVVGSSSTPGDLLGAGSELEPRSLRRLGGVFGTTSRASSPTPRACSR